MSLTENIKTNKNNIKDILKNISPNKSDIYTLSGNIPFSSNYVLKAPSDLSVYGSAIIGTAFDYIARVLIARKTSNLNMMKNIKALYGYILLLEYFKDNKKFVQKLNYTFKLAFDDCISFIQGEDMDCNNLINRCVFLSYLEQVYRGNYNLRINIFDDNKKYRNELNVLIDIFIKDFLDTIVKSDSFAVFNPHFGAGSQLVGGADADIIIDDVLYDFKTTKDYKYKSDDILQIVGYYYLYKYDGVYFDDDKINCNIKKIALYKARFGEIEYINVDDIKSQESVNILF